MDEIKRYKHGEVRDDGMVFLRYKDGKEKWGTVQEYEKKKEAARKVYHSCFKRNPNGHREIWRKSAEKNKDKRAERGKKWYYERGGKEKTKEYARKNRGKDNAARRGLSRERKDKRNEVARLWRKNNPEKMAIQTKKRVEKKRIRRHEDALYKFKHSMRSLISGAFERKGYNKPSKTEDILGCQSGYFQKWISDQFIEGMSFENHGKGDGKWNVDHIIPVDYAKNCEDVKILNHHLNLRPLWEQDNLKKSASIPDNVNELFQKLKDEILKTPFMKL